MVVFISILATIAISRFRNVSQQSIDATIKSDIRNAMTAEEQYYADQEAYLSFSVANGGAATGVEFQASPGVSVTATLQGAGVMIVGSHPATTDSWCMSTSSGEVVRASSC